MAATVRANPSRGRIQGECRYHWEAGRLLLPLCPPSLARPRLGLSSHGVLGCQCCAPALVCPRPGAEEEEATRREGLIGKWRFPRTPTSTSRLEQGHMGTVAGSWTRFRERVTSGPVSEKEGLPGVESQRWPSQSKELAKTMCVSVQRTHGAVLIKET